MDRQPEKIERPIAPPNKVVPCCRFCTCVRRLERAIRRRRLERAVSVEKREVR